MTARARWHAWRRAIGRARRESAHWHGLPILGTAADRHAAHMLALVPQDLQTALTPTEPTRDRIARAADDWIRRAAALGYIPAITPDDELRVWIAAECKRACNSALGADVVRAMLEQEHLSRTPALRWQALASAARERGIHSEELDL
jgi:hypothetical protein